MEMTIRDLPFWKRIGTRIFVSLIGICVLAICTTGILVVVRSRQSLKEEIMQRNLQIAKRAASEIARYMQESTDKVKATANLLALVSENTFFQEVIVGSLQTNLFEHHNICVVDEYGTVVASGVFGDQPRVPSTDLIRSTIGDGGEFTTSEVQLTKDYLPYITFLAPMKILGSYKHALVVDVSLREIWDLVDDISIGESGRAFLVSKSGVLLAHTDKSRILTKLKDEDRESLPESLEAGGQIRIEPVNHAQTALRVYVCVDKTDWILVVEQLLEEAYGGLRIVLMETLALIAGCIVISLFASLLLAHSIGSRVGKLVEASNRIGSGEFDFLVETGTEDEFGRLAFSFNNMAKQLKERTRELQKSEKQYRLLTENVYDIVFSVTGQGCFSFVNQRVEEITGYAVGEVIGKSYMRFVAPENRRIIVEAFRERLFRSSQNSIELEIECSTKRAKNVTIEARVVRVEGESGSKQYYGVGRDITEKKRIQERLVEAEKLSSIGELVSGVAHEINNPLLSIMGFSELALMEPDLRAETKENLKLVYDETKRIKRIVQNLLTFARRHVSEKKLCQLNQIIEDVLEVRKYEMISSNVEIVRELDPGLPLALVDSHQMRQVFLNIINNSLQAMKEAEGTKRLKVGTELQEDSIFVNFEDTGPGISQENISRVFDPFFTTKDIGEGTGLGLSVSHGIIREHGGEIRVESRQGEGARFLIELPVEEGISQGEERGLTEEENEIFPAHVLVIDDEESILRLLRTFLTGEGCQVDTVTDGKRALAFLREKHYDLIISDLRMPEFDGWKLYEWVAQSRPDLKEKIVFMTGDIVSQDVQTFFRETNAHYVSKPFNIRELKALILHSLPKK